MKYYQIDNNEATILNEFQKENLAQMIDKYIVAVWKVKKIEKLKRLKSDRNF